MRANWPVKRLSAKAGSRLSYSSKKNDPRSIRSGGLFFGGLFFYTRALWLRLDAQPFFVKDMRALGRGGEVQLLPTFKMRRVFDLGDELRTSGR